MGDHDEMQRLPPIVVPGGIDWHATTKEYVSLLGLSQRTPKQEGRYHHLSRLMDRKPAPWMTSAEQAAYERCVDGTDQALLAAIQPGPLKTGVTE